MSNFCITVSNNQDEFQVDESKLEKIGTVMFNYLLIKPDIMSLSALKDCNLSNKILNIDILICDDKEIQELNSKYRNIDKPTDVLSFAIYADSPESRTMFGDMISLGDIVISAQTAKIQADENNKNFDEEINFLLSHGLLHLMGFDHVNDEELNFMLKVQYEMIQYAINNT